MRHFEEDKITINFKKICLPDKRLLEKHLNNFTIGKKKRKATQKKERKEARTRLPIN